MILEHRFTGEQLSVEEVRESKISLATKNRVTPDARSSS